MTFLSLLFKFSVFYCMGRKKKYNTQEELKQAIREKSTKYYLKNKSIIKEKNLKTYHENKRNIQNN